MPYYKAGMKTFQKPRAPNWLRLRAGHFNGDFRKPSIHVSLHGVSDGLSTLMNLTASTIPDSILGSYVVLDHASCRHHR